MPNDKPSHSGSGELKVLRLLTNDTVEKAKAAQQFPCVVNRITDRIVRAAEEAVDAVQVAQDHVAQKLSTTSGR